MMQKCELLYFLALINDMWFFGIPFFLLTAPDIICNVAPFSGFEHYIILVTDSIIE
jgi:hypothetical protein